jgi:superfamily I DNA/RNA helicase
VAIFFSPSPQGDEDEEPYEKNAEMKEVDGVIISSIHRITGNEYFKQLFLRLSQNCFSARSAKEPSTQKSRLWDFFAKNGAL